MITRSRLVADFTTLGLKKGNIVMVHASLRSVGTVLGGPDALIDALLTAVGSGGTVMAYTDWQDAAQHLTRCESNEQADAALLEELVGSKY